MSLQIFWRQFESAVLKLTHRNVNEDPIEILTKGAAVWNERRQQSPEIRPAFRGARLNDLDLRDVILDHSDLSDANLSATDLSGAKLVYANLSGAVLADAGWVHTANLSGADLTRVSLAEADLTGADSGHVTLTGADLTGPS